MTATIWEATVAVSLGDWQVNPLTKFYVAQICFVLQNECAAAQHCSRFLRAALPKLCQVMFSVAEVIDY